MLLFKTFERCEGKFVSVRHTFFAILLVLVAFVIPDQRAFAQQEDGYRLASGDRVSIRVLSWNALTLKFEAFTDLEGTFGVDPGGQLVLPLLQPLQADGQTPAALSEELSELYRDRLGLSAPPSVTLEIVEFGPVYVLGDVARPGRYDFAPGLTAIQAFALAGGVYRIADTQPDGAASAIRASGTLEEITIDLVRLGTTQARLKAEIEGRDSFDKPDLAPGAAGPAAQDALFQQELGLFESRRERLKRALTSIEESRGLLQTELSALEEKLGGIQKQLVLIRQSVGNMETLRERGLARSPALVALQSTQIELEARELDAETAIFRARQRLSDLDREASDLHTGRHVQILEEIQSTETQISRLEARRAMTLRLLAGAEALMSDSKQLFRTDLRFEILQGSGQGQVTLPASESTRLTPRDVLVVSVITVAE